MEVEGQDPTSDQFPPDVPPVAALVMEQGFVPRPVGAQAASNQLIMEFAPLTS
ncbi:hypothetical protein GCM10010193_67600 [Kitasatospora atroaurantiaca]